MCSLVCIYLRASVDILLICRRPSYVVILRYVWHHIRLRRRRVVKIVPKYCFDAFICRGRLWLYSSAGRLKTFRPVFSGQAKDTLAGTVGLLYKQSGLKDTINGFTRMGGPLGWPLTADRRHLFPLNACMLYASRACAIQLSCIRRSASCREPRSCPDQSRLPPSPHRM